MNKILISLSIISLTSAFAVRDMELVKPKYIDNSTKTLYKKVLYKSNIGTKINDIIYTNEMNCMIYSDNFRVIYGLEYKDILKSQAKTILKYAQEVWQKEIQEFGFKAPTNSDKYYMDIYIANKNSYNYDRFSYETVSNNYAGAAYEYDDKTPYFSLNPNLNDNILKVTLAHEFFHSVQYGYYSKFIPDNVWYKNIWWYEASAVLMEDELYTEVNDYRGFISYYFDTTYLGFEEYDGAREYGLVVLAKYLHQNYGMDFIKSIFENSDENSLYIDVIKKQLESKDISWDSFMDDFILWCTNPSDNFTEGNKFSKLKLFKSSDKKNIKEGGFLTIDDNYNYFQGKIDQYSIINIDDSIFIKNYKKLALNYNTYSKNIYQDITIPKGWSLFGNSFHDKLDLSYFNSASILWFYKDGKYTAYSSDNETSYTIEQSAYSYSKDYIQRDDAFWIYSPYEFSLDINAEYNNSTDTSIKSSEYKLEVISPLYTNSMDKYNDKIIWSYENNKWRLYFGNIELENIDKLDSLNPKNGYFIKDI